MTFCWSLLRLAAVHESSLIVSLPRFVRRVERSECSAWDRLPAFGPRPHRLVLRLTQDALEAFSAKNNQSLDGRRCGRELPPPSTPNPDPAPTIPMPATSRPAPERAPRGCGGVSRVVAAALADGLEVVALGDAPVRDHPAVAARLLEDHPEAWALVAHGRQREER